MSDPFRRHGTISRVTSSLAGPLSAAVARLVQTLRPQVGPGTAAGFDEVLRRLSVLL